VTVHEQCASFFKGLAVLIGLMLIAEVAIGLQQDGAAAIGLLLLQATRFVVIAAFLWGVGDIALMLIESNHDLRASRILLGRVHAKLETLVAGGAATNATQTPPVPPAQSPDESAR
jgi:hypothetical protein